eukprot:m.256250 g.256250  ORF g.256250 m.256250 type:complete len:136 (+) comp40400_c1_seq63:416-823(+)
MTCSPSCENGGRCIGPDMCFCLAGFHGDSCELSGCPRLPVPENAFLTTNVTSFALQSTVTYECGPDFALVGESQRTCCTFGWTGTAPECVEIVIPFSAPTPTFKAVVLFPLLSTLSLSHFVRSCRKVSYSSPAKE